MGRTHAIPSARSGRSHGPFAVESSVDLSCGRFDRGLPRFPPSVVDQRKGLPTDHFRETLLLMASIRACYIRGWGVVCCFRGGLGHVPFQPYPSALPSCFARSDLHGADDKFFISIEVTDEVQRGTNKSLLNNWVRATSKWLKTKPKEKPWVLRIK